VGGNGHAPRRVKPQLVLPGVRIRSVFGGWRRWQTTPAQVVAERSAYGLGSLDEGSRALTFEALIRSRSAAEYADFVLPSVRSGDRIIDVGCGRGSITVGLAQVAGHVIGVDLDEADFTDARAYAAEHGIDNVEFVEGSVYQLDFVDASFDVCTLCSMMETLDDPLAGLAEVRRVVKPGGLVGASSIEYGGLILHGPDEPLLRRFYELRLQLWEAQGDVHFYRGRELRGLLLAAGFSQVEAVTKYFSYGTEERVRTFGLGRAADCRDEWYVGGIARHGFADQDEIDALEQAWIRWAESPDSFAAFAWGRAVGRRPYP
jgi:2-polyprenyl-3-methyl-5-hydroxy-6-metoxy-1,4-benzoquinol methylase